MLKHIQVYLEEELGFTVCIHDRDFDLGQDIITNIQKKIEKSRRSIAIISRYVVCILRRSCRQTSLLDTIQQYLRESMHLSCSFLLREALFHQESTPAKWLLTEFKHAHLHSEQRNRKYLITLMLDDIKASEIDDPYLKIHIETKTYENCKDLVSVIILY